jgi:hypothetical protein
MYNEQRLRFGWAAAVHRGTALGQESDDPFGLEDALTLQRKVAELAQRYDPPPKAVIDDARAVFEHAVGDSPEVLETPPGQQEG